jgi:hypothetical protein
MEPTRFVSRNYHLTQIFWSYPRVGAYISMTQRSFLFCSNEQQHYYVRNQAASEAQQSPDGYTVADLPTCTSPLSGICMSLKTLKLKRLNDL